MVALCCMAASHSPPSSLRLASSKCGPQAGYYQKEKADYFRNSAAFSLCDTILPVLDMKLIPKASSGDSKVFFQVLMAWHRYLIDGGEFVLAEAVLAELAKLAETECDDHDDHDEDDDDILHVDLAATLARIAAFIAAFSLGDAASAAAKRAHLDFEYMYCQLKDDNVHKQFPGAVACKDGDKEFFAASLDEEELDEAEESYFPSVCVFFETSDTVDGPSRGGKDWRFGRCASQHFTPSLAGAAKAPDVSVVDLMRRLEKGTTYTEIDAALTEAAVDPITGISDWMADAAVSTDFASYMSSSFSDFRAGTALNDNFVRVKVEGELPMICDSILNMCEVLDPHLIPKAFLGDSNVFYHQKKADNYRNIADFSYGDAAVKAAENALVTLD